MVTELLQKYILTGIKDVQIILEFHLDFGKMAEMTMLAVPLLFMNTNSHIRLLNGTIIRYSLLMQSMVGVQVKIPPLPRRHGSHFQEIIIPLSKL